MLLKSTLDFANIGSRDIVDVHLLQVTHEFTWVRVELGLAFGYWKRVRVRVSTITIADTYLRVRGEWNWGQGWNFDSIRGEGDYFLRLYTPLSIVGLARWSYSVIVNHKTGRILIRSSLSSQSPDFVTVHGQVALSVFS